MPTLLLQTPGRRIGASQRNSLAVSSLVGYAGDHGAVNAQISQLAVRQRLQFADGLFEHPATLQTNANGFHDGSGPVNNAVGCST